MIYDITLTVVDSATSTTHAGAAVSIEVVQVVGQVNTGSSITDGDKGDITVSDSGETLTINDGAVTAAKLENSGVSAASYGSASAIPVITVDEKGRITSATTQAPASGGSRRILAATLTYSGSPGTRANQISATVVGTLPDPATVLSGGTLQSIQYVVESLVSYSIQLDYKSLGVVNDLRVPLMFSFGYGNFNEADYVSYLPAQNISAFSSQAYLNAVDRKIPANVTIEGDWITSWGFTPTVAFRIGEPNYGLQEVAVGSVGKGASYSNVALSGTIKVYYLFG